MDFVRNNLPDFPSLPKYRISANFVDARASSIVGALELAGCEGEVCTFVDKRFPPAKGDSFLFKPFLPRKGDWYVMYEDGEKRFVREEFFKTHFVRSTGDDVDRTPNQEKRWGSGTAVEPGKNIDDYR